ncbi:MAG TPA: class A beta-lactamase-related serine hydrolase [Aliiroseovarius sp.]|nr:class A beta-lactamase-related serine hydrolase [Aliiroseovarius sp.]
MSDNVLLPLRSLMNRGGAAGLFQAGEALVARHQSVLARVAVGTEAGAVYDLASLTKPVATASILLHLVRQGVLELGAPVSQYLPAFRHADVTLRHLAAHMSGLPATAEFAMACTSQEEARAALFATALTTRPGTQVTYSCLGYLVLGEVIGAATGLPLNALFQDLVATPLGLTQTGFTPLSTGIKPARIVPSGTCPYRNIALKGRVHDSNAGLFGGVAGNAGLFGSARDLHLFAADLITRRAGFEPMFQAQTPAGQTPRSIGWEIKLPGAEPPSCGPKFPDFSIGHTGFTGTFLWLDPVSGLIAILLSNRTALSFRDTIPAMQGFRHDFAAIVSH